MSLEKTFSIQSADLSVKDEGPWKTPREMVSLFHNHDWGSEIALEKKLENEGEQSCPVGLILVRESGVYVHLCPRGEGDITIYCTLLRPKRILGLFKMELYKLVTVEKASEAFALQAMSKFMANDQDWLQININQEIPHE